MNRSEVRDYILKSLYENEYMFLARDKDGILNAYKNKPRKLSIDWVSDCVSWYRVFEAKGENIFDCVKWEDEEPLDIVKELGVVDWSKVPVNTRVYVSNKSITDIESKNVFKRYFAYYRNGSESPFQVFENGTTSFTVRREGNEPATSGWKYCKLAEEQK